uniref:Transposase (Putative), gypsy type n=1 Tax=Tanacetum cinerariifolium TaxID=118510 RepID=A0A6L2LCJ5_TANCI|nr:hypothetical protein [Tanacetum cinerariifolium]
MSFDSFHSDLTALEFDAFFNDYEIGSDFGPKLPGSNDTIRDFPEGKIDVYTRFFEFANFRLPLSMFFLRVCPMEFPYDSIVDGVDGDMVLETFLNVNSTRIRRYLEEFLVLIGLSRMWYAPLTRPVFYDDDEEGRCLRGITLGGSSFGVVTVGELASKADDALSIQLFGDPPSIVASKAREFIPGISTAAPKRMAVKSKKPVASKKPLSKKGQLVICLPKSIMGSPWSIGDWLMTLSWIKGPLCCSFIDHLATPAEFSCLRSLSHQDVCDRANVDAIRHITLFFEIRLRLEHTKLVRGKLERRLVSHDTALDKRDAKIKRLQKLVLASDLSSIGIQKLVVD